MLPKAPEYRRPAPKPELARWANDRKEAITRAEQKRSEVHGFSGQRPPPPVSFSSTPPPVLRPSRSMPTVRPARRRPHSAAPGSGRGQQDMYVSSVGQLSPSFSSVSPLAGELEATTQVLGDARKQLLDVRRAARNAP